jgi:carbonic anhydrase/acetyltransferase-like protein (isoleucine patch superfamily)
MPIHQFDVHVPVIADTAWVAESATVIGRVELAAESSVWYGSVLRGDNDFIIVGRGSNIQDQCMLHTDTGYRLVVGENVSIGHQVVLHGCSIGDGSLIGIHSVILNGAKIGRSCLVGAGSLITENKEFPDGSLIMGAPARVVRHLEPAQIERLLGNAKGYVEQARRHREMLKRVG